MSKPSGSQSHTCSEGWIWWRGVSTQHVTWLQSARPHLPWLQQGPCRGDGVSTASRCSCLVAQTAARGCVLVALLRLSLSLIAFPSSLLSRGSTQAPSSQRYPASPLSELQSRWAAGAGHTARVSGSAGRFQLAAPASCFSATTCRTQM